MDDLQLVREHFTGTSPTETVTRDGQRRLERAMRDANHGRRRFLLLAGLPLAAATAAAAAAVVFAVPSSAPAPRHDDAAALRARLTAAITAASGDVAVIDTSGGGSTNRTWIWPWYPQTGQRVLGQENELGVPGKQVWFSFTMPARSAVQPPGPLQIGQSWRVCTSVTWTKISLATHTWYRYVQAPVQTKRGCMAFAPLPDSGNQILAQIRAGQWHLAGHGQADGQQAVELTTTERLRRPPFHPSWPAYGPPITFHLWVSPHSYLPIRSEMIVRGRPEVVTTYAFRPATAAGLASVRPRLSGLSQVAPPS
jgi:hypothetical protein